MQIVREFIQTKSTSAWRFIAEQCVFLFLQNIPTVFGLAIRGLCYRMVIKSSGVFGFEENVQVTHARNLYIGNNAFVGKNSYLGASDGGIVLEDNVRLMANCYLNLFSYQKHQQKGNKIILSKNVVLSSGCVIHGHSGVIIGMNTIVGPNTTFISGKHGTLQKDMDYRFAEIEKTQPISIGSNVWIGTNVSILPGVQIGDHAVIGAGSVVTRDVPANTVSAGNPAKELRKLD